DLLERLSRPLRLCALLRLARLPGGDPLAVLPLLPLPLHGHVELHIAPALLRDVTVPRLDLLAPFDGHCVTSFSLAGRHALVSYSSRAGYASRTASPVTCLTGISRS